MPTSLASAVVVGATGLVGSRLVRALATHPGCERVVTLGRRAPAEELPRVTHVEVDLGAPTAYMDHLDVDCVFCTLGTTIKKAGSEGAFRRVDYEYPLTVARAAAAQGARRYVIVTAVGADAKSRVFYNRVKGELEEALGKLSFPRGLRVLHPSIILGARDESRPGESFAQALMGATAPLFGLGLTKYKAIAAGTLAKAMIAAAESESDGTVVYEGKSLFDLG